MFFRNTGLLIVTVLLGLSLNMGCASSELDEPLDNTVEENDNSNHQQNQANDNQANQANQANDNQPTNQHEEPVERGTQMALSAGGGDGQSENYRSRVSIGAPAPAGGGETENYRVKIGMGPVVIDASDD